MSITLGGPVIECRGVVECGVGSGGGAVLWTEVDCRRDDEYTGVGGDEV